jgi:hypothetical protein
MFNRRSFKSDDSFLEKISIGAVGTQQVFNDLRQQGHNPIELERGSMSFKIWKDIKIKRIRVPDILLLNSNRRIESRAKTKLEITMSHSFSNPDRAWDVGMEDDDYVALVGVSRSGERPIDWEADELVQYVAVGDLRRVYGSESIVRERPKGAGEGFEERITWLSSTASADGTVENITEDRLQYRRTTDNRLITLRLSKKSIPLNPQVEVGQHVITNQIVASVVPVALQFDVEHSASADTYIQQLTSSSQSERYTAAKALYHFDNPTVRSALSQKIDDTKDHIYVRLDAAASLMRNGDLRGQSFIQQCLTEPFVENQLEAVIVLGEIGTREAVQSLVQVLSDSSYHSEVRAGAAWAIGEIREKSALNVLIDSFNEVDDVIRIEAARALAKLAENSTNDILTAFPETETSKRPGVAWALSQASQFKIDQLIDVLQDDDLRRWVAFIVGTQDQGKYINEIEVLRSHDPEVYFATTVLWQIMNSWVFNLEMFG